MNGPQASLLSDGHRLHLNHGPIDLVIEAFGEPGEVAAAYDQSIARFQTVLDELVTELPSLRKPVVHGSTNEFATPVARRMFSAVIPYADQFITPMAAVAGSVADEILQALVNGRRIARAYVNNGGDIALFLSAGQSFALQIAGVAGDPDNRIDLDAGSAVRGVATSGWCGRSFSLGIADAVTVLAANAAQADAAATMIANAVDLPGHPVISRKPANELAPDSDLGSLPVTTAVGRLLQTECDEALESGWIVAQRLLNRRLIEGAAMFLADSMRISDTIRHRQLPKEAANARVPGS